ncbi:DUF488 domain-containing protein [Glutamicibacter arilaitensis]|uniref:DUF488 domain-containing protein n=1 Tax=Glutamicibacter arilaitensis TaxID=256701 RepID=UPI003FD17C7F
MDTGVLGLGYEGKTIDEYISDLLAWNVQTLIDVRLNAISRKKGFSKRALGEALDNAGITYLHRPELGNPKDNRDGFWSPGSPEAELAHRRYRAAISDAKANAAIQEITHLASTERVALLCFEADERCCHRSIILEAAKEELYAPAGV